MAYNGHNDGYNSHGMQDLNQNPAGVRHKLPSPTTTAAPHLPNAHLVPHIPSIPTAILALTCPALPCSCLAALDKIPILLLLLLLLNLPAPTFGP